MTLRTMLMQFFLIFYYEITYKELLETYKPVRYHHERALLTQIWERKRKRRKEEDAYKMHVEIKSNYEKYTLYCCFQWIKPMLVLPLSNKYVYFVNIPFLSKNLLLALQFLKDDSSSILVNTQNCLLNGTPCLFQAIGQLFF